MGILGRQMEVKKFSRRICWCVFLSTAKSSLQNTLWCFQGFTCNNFVLVHQRLESSCKIRSWGWLQSIYGSTRNMELHQHWIKTLDLWEGHLLRVCWSPLSLTCVTCNCTVSDLNLTKDFNRETEVPVQLCEGKTDIMVFWPLCFTEKSTKVCCCEIPDWKPQNFNNQGLCIKCQWVLNCFIHLLNSLN